MIDVYKGHPSQMESNFLSLVLFKLAFIAIVSNDFKNIRKGVKPFIEMIEHELKKAHLLGESGGGWRAFTMVSMCFPYIIPNSTTLLSHMVCAKFPFLSLCIGESKFHSIFKFHQNINQFPSQFTTF